MTQDRQTIFSVSEISSHLKKMVEQSYQNIQVRGEISGLKRHTSGHTYFALKDQDAVLDAVAWRGSVSQGVLQLEEGLEIIATGRLTTYPGRSKYQMIVSQFEAAGVGALLKQLEERKQRLAAEGLFSSDLKKSLPSFPGIIGVITSPTGAVIRDILHRLEDRFPCHVLVWPVPVQGPGAADQIAAAIRGFNDFSENRPDVLIVARGGGSLEDLWAFNEETVVRAAANSFIPLISAVGHETDTTLIDYASDQRAPTPTAAAEIAVPVMADLWRFLQERQHRLHHKIYYQLDTQDRLLSGLVRSILHPERLLEEKSQRLDDWHERLQKMILNQCDHRSLVLTQLVTRLRSPAVLIDNAKERLTTAYRFLEASFQHKMTHVGAVYEQLSRQLEQSSYHRQLERGFCHVTNSAQKAVVSAKDAKPYDQWSIHFQDGAVSVTVGGNALRPFPSKSKKTQPSFVQPKLF